MCGLRMTDVWAHDDSNKLAWAPGEEQKTGAHVF